MSRGSADGPTIINPMRGAMTTKLAATIAERSRPVRAGV
jgi:hypothetical protein